MSERDEVWARVAAEHPEFTHLHDVADNWRAVQEIVLGGSLTWRRAHELFTPAPGKVVLDIGANAGIYSAFCGAKGAEVYAFEPGRNSFALLSKMVEQTGLKKVHPIKAAVFDRAALMETVEHGIENNGISYFNGGIETTGITWGESDRAKAEVVPALNLDSIIDTIEEENIDCVKIDVEGAEVDIVFGARPSNFKRIEFMYIEVHDWMGPHNYHMMLNRLRRHFDVEGYTHPGTGLFEALYVTRKK